MSATDGRNGAEDAAAARPSKPDAGELEARLSALSGKLAEVEARREVEVRGRARVKDAAMAGAFGQGARIVGELVGAVGVSALIGWQLDRWMATGPLFLMIFLVLGTVAGFWSMYKTAVGTGRAAPAASGADKAGPGGEGR